MRKLLSALDAKEVRSDLWVGLISLLFVLNVGTLYSIVHSLIDRCEYFNELLYFQYFLVGILSTDLGITTWKDIQFNKLKNNAKHNKTTVLEEVPQIPAN